MKRFLKRPAVVCLVLFFCLSGCSGPQGSAGSPPAEAPRRQTVAFERMTYLRPDGERLREELGALAENIREAGCAEDQLAAAEEAGLLLEHFSTMATLASVHLSMDLTDPFWQGENQVLQSAAPALTDAYNGVTQALADSKYHSALEEALGEDFFLQAETERSLMSPEAQELYRQEAELSQAYFEQYASLTVDIKGKAMTLEDITGSAELFGEEFSDALHIWYERCNREVGEIFVRLVSVRQALAQTLGFESYEAMAYLCQGYDYTPAQVQALEADLKEHLAPLAQELRAQGEVPLEVQMSLEEGVSFLRETLGALSPTFLESLDFLAQYRLMDLSPRPGKQAGAFTTYFADYGAPFLFMSWRDDLDSLETLVHEFGHFHNCVQNPDRYESQTMDVAEIFSQGLELLAANHYAELLGGDLGDRALWGELSDTLETFLSQAYYDEFQRGVYALKGEELTVDSVNALAQSLAEEYGFSNPQYPWLSALTWVDVPHNVQSPFYTVSYVTAADLALQLWQLSRTDEALAVSAYERMMASEPGTPFLTLAEEAGLESPFAPGRAERMARDFRTWQRLFEARDPN